jgi:pyruvate dehydrogenase E2 component (dihydrolipoamide acetyltransferase)
VAYIGAPEEAVPDVNEASAVIPAVSAESTVPALATRSEPERRSPERVAGKVAALPAARRLASALGIDLTTLAGTGQDGVITVRDVERASEGAGDAK